MTTLATHTSRRSLAEMSNHQALFAGDSEIDQLHKIFFSLGTPDEASWPGVSQLPDWRDSFPAWQRKDMRALCPNLGADGLDLLEGMLRYDPAARVTAADALAHPFFDDIKQAGIVDHGMRMPAGLFENTQTHRN